MAQQPQVDISEVEPSIVDIFYNNPSAKILNDFKEKVLKTKEEEAKECKEHAEKVLALRERQVIALESIANALLYAPDGPEAKKAEKRFENKQLPPKCCPVVGTVYKYDGKKYRVHHITVRKTKGEEDTQDVVYADVDSWGATESRDYFEFSRLFVFSSSE